MASFIESIITNFAFGDQMLHGALSVNPLLRGDAAPISLFIVLEEQPGCVYFSGEIFFLNTFGLTG